MQVTSDLIDFFQQTLKNWYQDSDRPLPWKGIKDPYRIWLSEIILQQTRVEQGLPYYNRFVENFPSIHDLANASEDEVFKLWEGLGYYSRARNLHFTAKYISGELKGVFPDNYKDILTLKGVGPYTAAAIASFAYNLPHAVLDGNVFRVFSRFLGIKEAIDSTKGKKLFAEVSSKFLDQNNAGAYNQAIMDFGATHCTPKNPDCTQCPFRDRCVATQENLVSELPFKSKKLVKRKRYFHFLLFNTKDQIIIHKRTAKDIWQNLYDFPLIEKDKLLWEEEALSIPEGVPFELNNLTLSIRSISRSFQQTLSHQIIQANFWEIDLPKVPDKLPSGLMSIPREHLKNYAFPKIIDWYLQDNSLYLKL